MDYLHNQCASLLILCDLKPSNILLDLDMAAYISDFGLARFICMRDAGQDCSASLACLKGSTRNIPPGETRFVHKMLLLIRLCTNVKFVFNFIMFVYINAVYGMRGDINQG